VAATGRPESIAARLGKFCPTGKNFPSIRTAPAPPGEVFSIPPHVGLPIRAHPGTIQAKGLPEQWKKWEWPFISQAMWIDLIHQSLNK